ncbi:hypothetical protein AVEN_63833-1 [Araneus ventricosus]|uniref:Uncharacterized protein n=1 Tax=Araneus ventricosus TaxID=182803 RepID=A0A4Y2FUN1_ARAVE|nr:hypothetical protein AVEN_63833-1 [Araneus ventricosus]
MRRSRIIKRVLVRGRGYTNGGSKSRGGQVVRSRPRDRRVPVSKPDSTEESLCKRVWCTTGPNALLLVWCGAEVWRGVASSGVVLVI